MVKTYKNSKEYQKDAKKLSKKGWEVVNVTQEKRSAGIGRWLALGLLTPLMPPKPVLVVTYKKA